MAAVLWHRISTWSLLSFISYEKKKSLICLKSLEKAIASQEKEKDSW